MSITDLLVRMKFDSGIKFLYVEYGL